MTWLAYSHLGVAKTVQLTTQPAVALAGIPFGVQPVGRLVDGSGVLSRATGVTVTASKAGGTGTLSGTLSVQTVEGVFTFTDLKMDTVTSAVTLSFASSGLTSATSSAFNVTQPNTIIGCEVGTYTTTGTDATFARTRVCQCVPGSYVVTGTNTGLNLNGLLGTVLLTETFADANFAARDWYSIVSQDWVASPAPSGFSGSLRMTWNAGQTVPSSGGMRKLFTATDSLYIKYQQAFSSNWVGSGQAYHPHLVMALSDQDDPYAGPSDNYLALYSEVIYSGGNQPAVKFQDNQYIDGANIGSNIGEARGTCGGNGQQGYADSWDGYSDVGFSNGYYASRNLLGAAQTSPGDTAWHTVEVEVILNTIVGGVGQLDGICRYWWDGNLIWERTNLIMRTGTRPNLKFNQFLFAPYIGNGSPATQTTYIADLTVATARPVTFNPYGNKPAGYTTVLTDYPFSSVWPVAADQPVGDGTNWASNYNGSGYMARAVDATAPISPSYVVEWTYAQGQGSAGSSAGFGNALLQNLNPSATAIYVSFPIWHSAGFEWNATSNKMLMIWTYNAGTSGVAILESRHFANAFLSWQLENIPNDTAYYTATTPFGQSLTNSYFEGKWVNVEVQMIFGSNGTLRVWAGHTDGSDGAVGQLVLEQTGILVPAPSGGFEIGLHSTWGGGGGPTQRTSYRRADHMYISRP